MKRKRADQLLLEYGLAEDLAQARRLVMAGQVRADGQVVLKPSSEVEEGAQLTVDPGARYVSRGGEKLAAALEGFAIPVSGLVCADVGASTGGFTDCLLQNGAVRVYAIDVGHGILHWELRNDPRVVVMERTNARRLDRLPEPVDLVTIDASFISSKILLPVVCSWLQPSGTAILLVKPQFEATRAEAARGQGVVSDPVIHRRVLHEVLAAAVETGFRVRGLLPSPVRGPKGNTEFLAWLDRGQGESLAFESLVEEVLRG